MSFAPVPMTERKAAKARGMRVYYTGRLCKRGHDAVRKTDSGSCVACRQEDWRKRAARPEVKKYYRNYMRAKSKTPEYKEYRRQYSQRPEAKARAREHARRYMAKPENKEKKRAYYQRPEVKQRYRERSKCPDFKRRVAKRMAEYHREYFTRPEVIERLREYRNRPDVKQRRKEWDREYMKDPKNRARHATVMRNRKDAPGSHTAEDISEIYEAQGGRCAYCRKSVGDDYHVDHVIPLAKGGSNDRSNLQICCPRCNSQKQAKDPIDFAQEKGFLI